MPTPDYVAVYKSLCEKDSIPPRECSIRIAIACQNYRTQSFLESGVWFSRLEDHSISKEMLWEGHICLNNKKYVFEIKTRGKLISKIISLRTSN
jgi:hypothetical protein